MKYYFFIDETGDHGLSFIDEHFPIFLLAGCLFSETELLKLEQDFNNLKIDFFGTTEVILHSRDIRKCEGAFQIFFDLSIKQKFYDRLNTIFTNAHFTIIGAGIDKREYIKKYGKSARDPYGLSLSFILERLVFCIDASPGNVDIAIEKRGRKEDRKLLDNYNAILDRGTFYVKPDRMQKVINQFRYFLKRENVNGLQVADLCAYPLARHVLNSEEPYIPFSIIKDKIYCDKSGKYDGYGLKMFP